MLSALLSKFKSIGGKLFLLAFFPLIAFISLASFSILSSYRSYQESSTILGHYQTIKNASLLIRELEREMGVAALFVTDISTEVELKEARLKVDALFSQTAKSAMKLLPDEESRQSFDQNVNLLNGIRKQCDEKSANAVQANIAYVTIIDRHIKLLNYLSVYSSATGHGDIGARLASLILLEQARLSAARVQALMSVALAKSVPIKQDTYNRMMLQKSGIEVNLSSPSLIISREGIALLTEKQKQLPWAAFNEVSQAVLRNADQGEFGEDPRAFFNNIETMIVDITAVLSLEMKSVDDLLLSINTSEKKTLIFTIAGLLGVIVTLAALYWIVASRLKTELLKMTSHLQEATDEIRDASQKMTSASTTLSDTSTGAASALEETVASLEEISSMVKSNASNSQQASQNSEQANHYSTNGEKEIQNLILAMKEISASSKRIEEITVVIDDIAFQTNLLALNAAVEAARAGEQGRGFAVVADAVRELAQKSSASAKDISDLIRDSVSKIERGVKAADSSNVALKKITEAIGKLTVLNQEIALSSQEQNQGILQISQVMNSLDSTTQQNASSSSEIANSATTLSKQANSLADLVNSLVHLVEGASDSTAKQ